MPVHSKCSVAFCEVLPAQPCVAEDPMLWRGLSFEEVRLQGYRELDQLHSILYSLYNTTIQNLYARLKAAAQQVECIILGELGENGTARHVASFLSSHGFDESPEDVAKRTVAYPGPVVVLPKAEVGCKGYPTFIWKTPAVDKAELKFRSILHGDDRNAVEEELIEDHIKMFRDAIAAQRVLIAKLVETLSLSSTLDRLTECLTLLMVPAKSIKRITQQVSQLDCLWKDSIPAEWLSKALKPVAKVNKDCIIQELSSRLHGTADCIVIISEGESGRDFGKLQSLAIVPRAHAITSSHSSKQGTRWGLRFFKGLAAVGVAVAGLVAGRNDPTVHAMGRVCFKSMIS